MADDPLRELLLERQVLHAGKYLTFHLDTVVDVDARPHRREVIVHPGGVAMVPLLESGEVLFVRQYRHAVTEICLELPAGTLDRSDDGSPEDPHSAAVRELAEETGHEAADWRTLGNFFTAPGFATELMHLYLARGLRPLEGYGGPDPDERLELVRLTWTEALDMAERGEIRDAKTLVALFWVDRLARRGEVPELRAS